VVSFSAQRGEIVNIEGMSGLTAVLQAAIRQNGPIPVSRRARASLLPWINDVAERRGASVHARYMAAALSHPTFGYYTSRNNQIATSQGARAKRLSTAKVAPRACS
jgi:hypothetical protein